jgi:preprotein translocase subunit SecY
MILDTFRNIFKIGELRKRILFTLMILAVERIGTHIVTPGIDAAALAEGFKNLQGTLFGLYDLFAGGAFSKAAVFALKQSIFTPAKLNDQPVTTTIDVPVKFILDE